MSFLNLEGESECLDADFEWDALELIVEDDRFPFLRLSLFKSSLELCDPSDFLTFGRDRLRERLSRRLGWLGRDLMHLNAESKNLRTVRN